LNYACKIKQPEFFDTVMCADAQSSVRIGDQHQMNESQTLLQALISLQTASTDAVTMITSSLSGDDSISTDDVTDCLESVIVAIEGLGLVLEGESNPDADIADWLRETLSINIRPASGPAGFRVIPGGKPST
jgi:hypothetical protein